MTAERSPHILYRDKPYARYHHVVSGLAVELTPPGGGVLDLGCGLGHILDLIRRANPGLQLTGADPDPVCLEAVANRVPGVKTLQISEREVEPDKLGRDYDTCVMSHSLEHTLSPAESIRRVLQVLRPGGHLVLAVPNPVRPQVFFGNIRKRHYVNRGHAYAWDRSHWMNFLEEILGLEVVCYAEDEVKIFSDRISQRFGPIKSFEIALARWLPWWSFSNIAVVRASGPPASPADV